MMIVPLAALALLWFLLTRTSSAARLMRRMSPDVPAKALSIGLVVLAILVLARGNLWAALCLFGVSLYLLGRSKRHADVHVPNTNVVWARSATIEIERDLVTGRMRGQVVAGPQSGVVLDTMDLRQCSALYAVCCRQDPDGARLLEAYLDRRFPGWRTTADDNIHPREPKARFTSRMSENEAYEVLGLRRGASRDDVVRSHRTIMKRWHPDQGGTDDLAARANEAKEVLLRRHA